MQMLIGNKYILWITVLLSVAVLQGIAISRDQLMTPKEKPILMVTEDFAFLRQVEPENMKVHPVALVASLEEMREISEMAKPLAVEFDHPEMSFNAEGKAGEKSTQTGEGSHSSISSKSAESQQGSLKSKVKSPKVNPLKNQIKNGEFIYHKVLRGETLSSIVKLYDMTVSQLVLTNGISDPDHIYPGYSLKIAVEKEFFHTVREGDTLWSVSRLYGVGVKLLKTLNGLKEDWLIAGQRIKIRIDDLSQESVQRVILARKTKSRFMWPVTGRVSDQLGWRIHPVTRKRDYHKGVDIAAPKGQKIVASATGKVLYSGASRGYGNLIILQHDGGYTSRYAHCSSLSAKGGETVIQGQVIAKVGATGLATGPHLHFELRKKGKIVDPEDFIGPLPGSYGGRVIARR